MIIKHSTKGIATGFSLIEIVFLMATIGISLVLISYLASQIRSTVSYDSSHTSLPIFIKLMNQVITLENSCTSALQKTDPLQVNGDQAPLSFLIPSINSTPLAAQTEVLSLGLKITKLNLLLEPGNYPKADPFNSNNLLYSGLLIAGFTPLVTNTMTPLLTDRIIGSLTVSVDKTSLIPEKCYSLQPNEVTCRELGGVYKPGDPIPCQRCPDGTVLYNDTCMTPTEFIVQSTRETCRGETENSPGASIDTVVPILASNQIQCKNYYCPNGQTWVGNTCQPFCVLNCPAGTIAKCVDNVKTCNPPHGTGHQNFTGYSINTCTVDWSICIIDSCIAGYTLLNNYCYQNCGAQIHGSTWSANSGQWNHSYVFDHRNHFGRDLDFMIKEMCVTHFDYSCNDGTVNTSSYNICNPPYRDDHGHLNAWITCVAAASGAGIWAFIFQMICTNNTANLLSTLP